MPATPRVGAPRNIFRTVAPSRRKNGDLRAREYLTSAEVKRLMEAARSGGRYGHRDVTMILIGYRHGLMVSRAPKG